MDAFAEMFCLFLFFSASVVTGKSDGELTILHSPGYVHFLASDKSIDVAEIPAVIASYLGLPLNSDIKWDGLAEGSPFQRPKASIIISVDSLPSGKLKVFQNKYTTKENDGDFDSKMMINYIQSFDWKKEPMLIDLSVVNSVVDLRSQHMEFFTDLPNSVSGVYENAILANKWFKANELQSLNMTNDADLQFASELYLIKEIINHIELHPEALQNQSPDFFHFKVSGLEMLIRESGVRSQRVTDSIHLLRKVLDEVIMDFRRLYQDNCVIQVVGLPEFNQGAMSRKGRNLLQAGSSSSNTSSLNLAPEFTDDYPVVFNIILWTMITLAIAIFLISWGIWNMDPGRDSLIYRMTSQRKKND